MVISDETLIAYSAGALSARGRREVEAALADSPQLVRRLEELQGAAAEIHAPARLTAVEGGAARAAPVVDLAAARAARAPAPAPASRLSRLAPVALVGVALIGGIAIGHFMLPASQARNGDLFLARGQLADALDHRLSTSQQQGDVRLGYSFMTNDGVLCRTFQTAGDDPRAGFACREGERWRIRMITAIAAHPATDEPALVAQGVAEIRRGPPLDEGAERQVLRR